MNTNKTKSAIKETKSMKAIKQLLNKLEQLNSLQIVEKRADYDKKLQILPGSNTGSVTSLR